MVVEPLVVTFSMIMRQKLTARPAQRSFPKQDHAIQAGFFDAAHELRGFGVFNIRPRKTGIGRNPRTGQEVII